MTASAIGTTSNWTPLEAKLAPELCAEFMWMYRDRGVEHYKHIQTRRYLRLDSVGRCLARQGDSFYEIPFDDEWKWVSGRSEGEENAIA
jgi:hypothetical protein